MNRIQESFDDIRADDALLKKTEAYLQDQREKQSSNKRFSFQPLQHIAALTVLLVLLVGVSSYKMLFTTISYVNIDVNPSVELRLNRMNQIIGTQAFNDDGEQILNELGLSGKGYKEAIAMLLSAFDRHGYLSDDALISATVQTVNKEKEKALSDTLRKSLDTTPSTVKLDLFPVSSQILDKAHDCRMSPARYLAIQELLAVDKTATPKEYSDSSIREIQKRTQTCRERHQESSSYKDNSKGQGQGNGQDKNKEQQDKPRQPQHGRTGGKKEYPDSKKKHSH